MLIPQTFTLAGYRGATFLEQVNFWQDAAKTNPFDFSQWTVAVTVTGNGNQPALTLHTNISGGSIVFSLSYLETAAAGTSYHIKITLTSVTGSPPDVEFLATGTLTFTDP